MLAKISPRKSGVKYWQNILKFMTYSCLEASSNQIPRTNVPVKQLIDMILKTRYFCCNLIYKKIARFFEVLQTLEVQMYFFDKENPEKFTIYLFSWVIALILFSKIRVKRKVGFIKKFRGLSN